MRGFVFAAAAAALASAAEAAEHVVAMEGMAYVPDTLAARVGDTVRFVNRDGMDHDVFVPTVGYAVDLGKQEPGQEAVLPLGKAGRFEVECVFHPNMLLTVEVEK